MIVSPQSITAIGVVPSQTYSRWIVPAALLSAIN
jgi:hypothetical protein